MQAPSRIGVGHVGFHDMVQGCAATPNKVRFSQEIASNCAINEFEPNFHKFGHPNYAEIGGKYAEIDGKYVEIGGIYAEIGGKAKTNTLLKLFLCRLNKLRTGHQSYVALMNIW